MLWSCQVTQDLHSLCAGELAERPSRDSARGTPLQPSDSGAMPVGTPLDDTAVLILPWQDDDTGSPASQISEGQSILELAEHGSVGEVCIAGACVAAGYLANHPCSEGTGLLF